MQTRERCINCQQFISKDSHTCKSIWNKGKTLSEEHKQKISDNAKLNPNYGMRGKKVSEETKRKMSKSHKWYLPTQETKKKLSESLKKYFASNHEARIKIREKLNSYKILDNYRKNLRQSLIGHIIPENTRKKISESNRGRKISEETRMKIGKANSIALRGKPSGRKGTHLSDKHKLILKEFRANQIFPKKDTKIEIKIQEYLRLMCLDFFTHQYMKEIEHGYQCDIFIPSLNMVVECDGNYWHHYPIGLEIDHIRTKELIEKGFKILRLWENEIQVLTLDSFKEKIYKM